MACREQTEFGTLKLPLVVSLGDFVQQALTARLKIMRSREPVVWRSVPLGLGPMGIQAPPA